MIKKLSVFTPNDIVSVLSFFVLVSSAFISFDSTALILVAGVVLAMAISSAVHDAEVIAHRLGSSLGTLILALSVTVIEVALIVSLMGNDSPDSATIARDTVFAAVMIVTNGIIGICIFLGGIKHKELGFQSLGTASLLGGLTVLAVITMVLPNYTVSTPGPTYSSGQLIFASIASLGLYSALVWAQTKSHKSYFKPLSESQIVDLEKASLVPTLPRAIISFIGLLLSLVAVVGLAKLLSPTIESSISWLGAPKSMVGIVVALLVLAPETLAAVNAAKTNQLQTSLNLALGSGAASIALTIPVVSIYSIYSGKALSLGLDPKNLVFLFTTLIAGGFTFSIGRTTAFSGAVHLTILVAFLAMTFMP